MLVRWKFDDLVTSETATFEINPDAGGSPAYEKQFQYQNTTAPGGKTLVFEGADQPQKIVFSGNILSQAQFETFITWWQKRNQIQITDDLERVFVVVIETFTPTRKRNASNQWLHTYEMHATIVDWP